MGEADIDAEEGEDLTIRKSDVFHLPCAFNKDGVSEQVCRDTTKVPVRNRECCRTECASKARACRVCINQGSVPGSVTNRFSGLCDFHEENGEELRRPESSDRKVSLVSSARAPLPVVRPQQEVVVTTRADRASILERVREALSKADFLEVDPKKIRRMPGQPRKYFDPERLGQLADSIRATGQIMPGFLRYIETDAEGHEYELMDGERRWRAVLMVGRPYRALVIRIDDSSVPYVISIIANFHRDGHTPMEISDAVKHMMENLKMSQAEIGEALGYHPVVVSRYYGLQRLVGEVRDMFDPNLCAKDKLLPRTAAFELMMVAPLNQVTYAKALLSGEMTLTDLRMHVRTSTPAHTAGRPRNPETHERWRACLRRAEAIESKLEDLISVIKATPLPDNPVPGSSSILTKRLLDKLTGKVDEARDLLKSLP